MTPAAILACFLALVCQMPTTAHRLHCGYVATTHIWTDHAGHQHFENTEPHKACYGRQATRRVAVS